MTSIQSLTPALRAVALAWRTAEPATQAGRQEAIRALDKAERGGLSLTCARMAAEVVAAQCREARNARARRRIEAGLGYTPISLGGYPLFSRRLGERTAWRDPAHGTPRLAKQRATLPAGTLVARLDARRRDELAAGVAACLTEYARQERPEITWVDTLGACHIELRKVEGWLDYGRKGNRRGITSAGYIVAALPRLDGCPRVQGGILTLGAVRAPALEDDGETVWQAAWARQGRGEPVREAGYIVARDVAGRRRYAHGATVSAARGVLTRAGHAAQASRWLEAVRGALESGRLNGYDVPVRLSDARRAGLCEPGIRAWCERHAIDPAGEVSVGTIIGIADQRSYVLAACLAAVRRQCRPH